MARLTAHTKNVRPAAAGTDDYPVYTVLANWNKKLSKDPLEYMEVLDTMVWHQTISVKRTTPHQYDPFCVLK